MTTQISGDTGVSQCQPGSVSQDDIASPYYLPKPQTWQNVTASRAFNTDYTNTTTLPIAGSVIFKNTVANSTFGANILVDTVAIATQDIIAGNGVGWNSTTLFAIVPPGSVYRLTGTQASLYSVRELK